MGLRGHISPRFDSQGCRHDILEPTSDVHGYVSAELLPLRLGGRHRVKGRASSPSLFFALEGSV